jgi:hypothetical protein
MNSLYHISYIILMPPPPPPQEKNKTRQLQALKCLPNFGKQVVLQLAHSEAV